MAEHESAALWEAIAGRRLATRRVAVVEVTKAVKRVDPEASPETMLARLAFVELDAEPPPPRQQGASNCAPSTPSMSLRHYAWAPELEAFITYDDRQAMPPRSTASPSTLPASRNPRNPSTVITSGPVITWPRDQDTDLADR